MVAHLAPRGIKTLNHKPYTSKNLQWLTLFLDSPKPEKPRMQESRPEALKPTES